MNSPKFGARILPILFKITLGMRVHFLVPFLNEPDLSIEQELNLISSTAPRSGRWSEPSAKQNSSHDFVSNVFFNRPWENRWRSVLRRLLWHLSCPCLTGRNWSGSESRVQFRSTRKVLCIWTKFIRWQPRTLVDFSRYNFVLHGTRLTSMSSRGLQVGTKVTSKEASCCLRCSFRFCCQWKRLAFWLAFVSRIHEVHDGGKCDSYQCHPKQRKSSWHAKLDQRNAGMQHHENRRFVHRYANTHPAGWSASGFLLCTSISKIVCVCKGWGLVFFTLLFFPLRLKKLKHTNA